MTQRLTDKEIEKLRALICEHEYVDMDWTKSLWLWINE